MMISRCESGNSGKGIAIITVLSDFDNHKQCGRSRRSYT